MEYLSSKLGIAIDWTSETAVPVIEEIADKYIRWEINTSITYIVICHTQPLPLSIKSWN